MILLEKLCELTETKILDLRSSVVARTGGRVHDLRISILNEEEIVVHGNCASDEIRQAAARGVLEMAPGASVRNRLQILPAESAEQQPTIEWQQPGGRKITVVGR